jgi:hypothetical protein
MSDKRIRLAFASTKDGASVFHETEPGRWEMLYLHRGEIDAGYFQSTVVGEFVAGGYTVTTVPLSSVLDLIKSCRNAVVA